MAFSLTYTIDDTNIMFLASVQISDGFRYGCDVNTNGDQQKFACCIAKGDMCDDGCSGNLPSTGKPKANWVLDSTGACSELCGGGIQNKQYRCRGRFHKYSTKVENCKPHCFKMKLNVRVP